MLQSILSFLAPTLFLVAGILAALALGLSVSWVASLPRGIPMLEAVKKLRMRIWLWVLDKNARASRIIDGIALVLVILGFATLGSEGKWGSLAPELVSTAVAIAVLDRLFNYRGEQREKRRIISQIGAKDSKDVAVDALAVARAEGWLYDGTFKGVDLNAANLKGADLRYAKLQGASLVNAYMPSANLNRANLQGANLEGAFLQDACLLGTFLQGANLEGTNLNNAYLENADLRGANLRGVDLKEANLRSAGLEGANLVRANLQGANLKHANLQNATYDFGTAWPDGFFPFECGCKLVED